MFIADLTHILPFDTGHASSPFGWDSFLIKTYGYFSIPFSVMFCTYEKYYTHVLGTCVLINYQDLVMLLAMLALECTLTGCVRICVA